MSTTVRWILGGAILLGLIFWMLSGGDEETRSSVRSTPAAASRSNLASVPEDSPAAPAPTPVKDALHIEEPASNPAEPSAEAASAVDAGLVDEELPDEGRREVEVPYDEPDEHSRELEEALNNPPEPTFGAAWHEAIENPYELPPEIEAMLENPPEVTHSEEVERLLRERPPVPIPRATQDAIDGPMPPTPLPE